jgi:rare lipoprotein A
MVNGFARTRPKALALYVAAALLAGAPEAQAGEPERPRETVKNPKLLKKSDWTLLQQGVASFYPGRKYRKGKKLLTAASRILPYGARITVTRPETGKSIVVVVNDKGPSMPDRILDLSEEAAEKLGFTREGLAIVRIEARPSDQPLPVREALTQLAHAQ